MWVIKDGNGSKERYFTLLFNINCKYSTNGTWVLAGIDEQITNEMIFKAGLSIFKVQIIN